MTREEAINVLKGMKHALKERDFRAEHEAIDMAIEALKEQKWTPCSEKPPSDDGWLTELDFDSWKQGYEQGKLWTQADIENSRGKCSTCKRNSDHVNHGTRCPIEEHYALPKDGYCHLYEPYKPESEE